MEAFQAPHPLLFSGLDCPLLLFLSSVKFSTHTPNTFPFISFGENVKRFDDAAVGAELRVRPACVGRCLRADVFGRKCETVR